MSDAATSGAGDERKFAAQVVRARAEELGELLAVRLLTEHPEIERRYRPMAGEGWRANFTHRLLDLAAAIDAGSPAMFAAHAAWARTAYASRGVPVTDLIASFRVMSDVLPREMPPEDAGLVMECVERALAEVGKVCGSDESALDPASACGRLAAEYLVAILEGDRARAADLMLRAVAEGLSVADAYTRVLLPAQVEVGRMWHQHEIGVAEEHLATATTLSVMARLGPLAPRAASNGLSVLAACVEGNAHDLGVRALGDFFEFAGWKAIVLGANTPAEDLAAATRDFGVDVVAISAALPVHLVHVESAIRLIREDAGGPPVIVGGGAFGGCEEAWGSLGADGYARDAQSAVVLAERLVRARV